MTIIRHPDDEVPFNPEPPDEDVLDDYGIAETMMRAAYEGAVVIEQENGDWLCEHGRNITGSPRASARACLTHCKGGAL